MPFKSQAQQRKFAELVKDGKISKKVFDEWSSGVDVKKLPERVKGSKPSKKTEVRHPLASKSTKRK